MDRIRSGRVSMRPKIYFIAGSVLFAGSVAVLVIVGVFAVSAAAFQVRMVSPLQFIGLGGPGIGFMASAMPWAAILAAVAGLWGSVRLLKHYDFSYRRNFAAISFVALAGAILAGSFLSVSGFTELRGPRAVLERKLGYGVPKRNFVVGTVVSVRPDEYELETPDGRRINVVLSESARKPRREIEPGDWMRAVGSWEGDSFRALGAGKGGKGTGERRAAEKFEFRGPQKIRK